MGDVVGIEEYLPHIVVRTERGAHVIPCRLVEDVVAGRQPVEHLLHLEDHGGDLARAIIGEWYEWLIHD